MLRTVNYRDYDRMLTLFTREEGMLSAAARGAHRQKSPLAAASTQFCTGEYLLLEKNGKYQVKNCMLDEAYYPLREDALRPITVSLYFLDPTSGALRAEKRALALYEGQTRVNALLEALAQGPESDALAALLPEEFTVLSARVEEGTCYLNLPSDADLGISPRQTVESLVLSLCSLDTVERVQIVVDGEIAAQLNGVNVGEPLTP